MQRIFIDFFSFSDPNVRYVVGGTLLITASAAMIGSFALLKRKVLVGDAVAHATLPGLCLAFMATSTQHPLLLVFGAFTTGWLATVLIDYITRRSKIKEDTAIALVLSFTFGLGILLLTVIQHTGNAAQIGLSNFLFGKAAALVSDDLSVLVFLSIILVLMLWLFFKELTLVAFDKAFARSSGLPVPFLELLFTSLMVLAIVVGIRTVGILLMTAMLITPPAAARCWTSHLPSMVGLAALLGMVAGLLGSFISYTAPSMPTGPWIVLVISLIAYGSFLFAPQQGLVARSLRKRSFRQKVLHENILKLFYELGAADVNYDRSRSPGALHACRPFTTPRKLLHGLKHLQTRNMLRKDSQGWCLTAAGKRKGEEISQLHRLWELYLTQYLKITPDHVHQDAESMEHVITPALAEELRKLVRPTEEGGQP